MLHLQVLTFVALAARHSAPTAGLERIDAVPWAEREFGPCCDRSEQIRPVRAGRRHQGKTCAHVFRISTASVCSDTPLQFWPKGFLALCRDTGQSQGSSSLPLAQTSAVRQPPAGSRLPRMRPAAGTGASALLGGNVEVDETCSGGQEKHKQADQRTAGRPGRSPRAKAVAGGMQAREGKLTAVHGTGAKVSDILPEALENGERAARIHAAELGSHSALAGFCSLSRVNYSSGEYVRDKAHTNSLESVRALVQRMYVGIHHCWSIQHTQRDRNACTFRFHHQGITVDTRRTAWLAAGRPTRPRQRIWSASPVS